MNEQLEQALEQLAEEKGITREELVSMIEASLAAAFRKDYGQKNQNIVAKFDPETMGTKLFDVKTVVATAEEAAEDPQKLIDLESAKEIPAKGGSQPKADQPPAGAINFGGNN